MVLVADYELVGTLKACPPQDVELPKKIKAKAFSWTAPIGVDRAYVLIPENTELEF